MATSRIRTQATSTTHRIEVTAIPSLIMLANITVRDRMFLRMQDFDFFPNLIKFAQIFYAKVAFTKFTFTQISPPIRPNFALILSKSN